MKKMAMDFCRFMINFNTRTGDHRPTMKSIILRQNLWRIYMVFRGGMQIRQLRFAISQQFQKNPEDTSM